MKNIKLTLQYDGSCFHGWQVQPNAPSVEETLKAAIDRILHEKVSLQSCSRTDAGVHALMFCCNFKTDADVDPYKFKRSLNGVLPPAVAVTGCDEALLSFHARYDCKGKRYLYQIWNAPQRNPFLLQRALHVPGKLDDALLDREAKAFVGTHDFAAFCAAGSSVKTTVRTVFDCGVRRKGELVTFSVSGDGFLYNMVRIMVGTLLEINAGKLPPGCIPQILVSRDRSRAGMTAKAGGLFLEKVFYKEDDACG